MKASPATLAPTNPATSGLSRASAAARTSSYVVGRGQPGLRRRGPCGRRAAGPTTRSGRASWSSPSADSWRALSLKVPASRPSSDRRRRRRCRAARWPTGCGARRAACAPITSGRSPAAALEVRIWLNWSSATGVSLTLIPLSSVKSSTIAWVAATRSGRSSTIQTVMLSRVTRRRRPVVAARGERGDQPIARRPAPRGVRPGTRAPAGACGAVGDGHEASGDWALTFVQTLDLSRHRCQAFVSSRYTDHVATVRLGPGRREVPVPTGPGDVLS